MTEERLKYRRYYRDEKSHPGSQYSNCNHGQFVQVSHIVAMADVPTLQSRYGYTYGGAFTRSHDRELGLQEAEN